MKFMPVIHVMDYGPTIRDVQIAIWNGADGVFLISHGVTPYYGLIEIYKSVRKHFPNIWIGLNFLDISVMDAIHQIPLCTNALWTDNAWIDETKSPPTVAAEAVWNFRKRKPEWKGLYFGGVAFKYQTEVKDLSLVTKAAVPFMDVVTTSGSATGSAPAKDKLVTMRKAAGKHPIAVASGLSRDNIHEFKGLIDYALVYSSISDQKERLNPTLVREMANAISRL